jgi:hypothetical protein
VSGFSNPITGGQGALVRPAIKSPDFLTAVRGWTINKDGSAEFNNVVVRGTVDISFSNGSEIRAYAGSYTSTDWNLTGAFVTFKPANDTGHTWIPGVIGTQIIAGTPSPANDVGAMVIASPCETGLDQASIELIGASATETASMFVGCPGGGSVLLDTTTCQFGVGAIAADTISIESPKVTTTNGIDIASETWHAFVFQNGFTNRGAPYANAQYRLVAAPSRCVQVIAHLNTGVVANGTIIVNLPLGYRPAHTIAVTAQSSATPAGRTAVVELDAAGNLKVFDYGAGVLQFNGLFSLDA